MADRSPEKTEAPSAVSLRPLNHPCEVASNAPGMGLSASIGFFAGANSTNPWIDLAAANSDVSGMASPSFDRIGPSKDRSLLGIDQSAEKLIPCALKRSITAR